MAESLQLLIQWFHSLGLLFKQNVNLPALYNYVRRFFNFVLNLDINGIPLVEYINALKKYTQWEYRVQFVVVNILIPLAVALVTLMLFESIAVILWYAVTILGVMAIVVGLIGYILPSAQYALLQRVEVLGEIELPVKRPEFLLMILGGIVVFLCVVIGIIYCLCQCANRRMRISKTEAKMDRDALKKHMARQARRERLRQFGGMAFQTMLKPKVRHELHDQAELEVEHQQLLQFSCTNTIINFIAVGILIFIGVFLFGPIKLRYFGWDPNPVDSALEDNSISTVARVFAVIGFLIAAFVLFQTLLQCCPCGRKLEYCCISFCKFNALRVVMIALTLLYTPVVTSLFQSFICTSVDCDAGSRFPINYNTLSMDTLLRYDYVDRNNASTVCETCTFHPACNCTIVDKVCPFVTSSRLLAEPSLSCTAEMPFFWPATGLLGITFLLGVPFFFFCLTCRGGQKLRGMDVEMLLAWHVPLWIRNPKLSAKLGKQYDEDMDKAEEELMQKRRWKKKPPSEFAFMQVDPPPELIIRRELEVQSAQMPKQRITNAEMWLIRTALTNNPARSLYIAFETKFRYFRVFQVIIKLLLVIATVCFLEMTYVSLPVILVIWVFFFLVLIFSWPYLSPVEDVLALLVTFVSVIDTIFLVVAYFGDGIAEWTFYPLVVVNAAIPILTVIVIFYSCCARKNSKRKYQMLIKRMEGLQKSGDINIRKRFNFTSISKNIRDTDELVTIISMKLVLTFFMFLGVAAFASLAFCGLGLLYGELNPAYIPNQYQVVKNAAVVETCVDVQVNEFARYTSWTDFTDNCCCQKSTHHEVSAFGSSYIEVELWTCANGELKERLRSLNVEDSSGNTVLVNATVIRPFCSKEFTAPWVLTMPCVTNGTVAYSYLTDPTGAEEIAHGELAEANDKFDIAKYYW